MIYLYPHKILRGGGYIGDITSVGHAVGRSAYIQTFLWCKLLSHFLSDSFETWNVITQMCRCAINPGWQLYALELSFHWHMKCTRTVILLCSVLNSSLRITWSTSMQCHRTHLFQRNMSSWFKKEVFSFFNWIFTQILSWSVYQSYYWNKRFI